MLMSSLFHTVAVRCVKIVPEKSHEVKRDRQDPTLSDTIRVLLLQKLTENSYLEDREKKALGVTTYPKPAPLMGCMVHMHTKS